MGKMKLLVVDDHAMMRDGIRALLKDGRRSPDKDYGKAGYTQSH